MPVHPKRHWLLQLLYLLPSARVPDLAATGLSAPFCQRLLAQLLCDEVDYGLFSEDMPKTMMLGL